MTLKTFALAFASLALVPAAPAHAGSCHGGGGGGGGSSSSSGGGGSSSGGGGGSSYSGGGYVSSSDTGSSTPACVDDSDVVGFRHCTKFGAWGANMRFPRLFVELGSSMRAFSSGLGDRTGQVQHGLEQFSYRVVMPTGGGDANRDLAMTTTLRLGFGVSRHLYSGLEGELGGLVAPATATAEMTTGSGTYGSPNVTQGNGLVLGIAAVGGYRAVGSRGSLAIEGAGGLRSVRYKFDSSYHDCATSTTIVDNRGVVEARARAELWLNPWLTAGVTLGANVLERDDWMAGIYLGAHSRAFAGGR